MTNPNPPNKHSRWPERILLLAGLAGTGAWLGSMAATFVGQSWDQWALLRRSHGQPVTIPAYLDDQRTRVRARWAPAPQPEAIPLQAVKPPEPIQPTQPPADNELIGRIFIPRLNLQTSVREGTSDPTLALAAGHISGTALPGENGNVGVAGHRDSLFRGLGGIRAQDLIEFETTEAKYVYQVTSTNIVKSESGGVLKAGLYPELTMVTCYPFDFIGSAPDRFIVKARLISQNPLQARKQMVQVRSDVEPKPVRAAATLRPSGRIPFEIAMRRSMQLTPGVSMGLTDVDVGARRVDGWLWVVPERRTIWLRKHPVLVPLFFQQDGKMRELRIATITATSASGYLMLNGEDR